MAWPKKGTSTRTGRKTAAPGGRSRKRVRKAKKYSGCTVKPSYTIRSGEDAGLVVNHDCFSIWMKLRGQPLITMVGTPHKEGYIVKAKTSGNEWHKYCFEVTSGIKSELTTGFVNPRTKTVHLPYLGVGYIASPSFGKTKGGACFHPTGKKK
jgi:hypothetical protein